MKKFILSIVFLGFAFPFGVAFASDEIAPAIPSAEIVIETNTVVSEATLINSYEVDPIDPVDPPNTPAPEVPSTFYGSGGSGFSSLAQSDEESIKHLLALVAEYLRLYAIVIASK